MVSVTGSDNCPLTHSFRVNQLFTVEQENVPCGQSGVTCTKAITVFYNDNKFHLIQGVELELNGKSVAVSDNDVAPGVRFTAAIQSFVLFFIQLNLVISSNGGDCILQLACDLLF